MRKFSGIIAMVLIMIILASSFTSCLSYVYRSAEPVKRVIFAIVDIMFLPLSLLALLIYIIITEADGEAAYQTYLAGAGNNIPAEYLFLMEKYSSLPEEEFALLRQLVAAIPESEYGFVMDKINSLSDAKRLSLVSAYTALPEAEIISSLNRINALSETERASLLQQFKSLSETEITTMIDELNLMQEEKDNFAFADNSAELAYIRQ
jgi:hypothetical protein